MGEMMEQESIQYITSIHTASFVCALRTPLMARAATALDLAKEIMFLDTRGTMEGSIIYKINNLL